MIKITLTDLKNAKIQEITNIILTINKMIHNWFFGLIKQSKYITGCIGYLNEL